MITCDVAILGGGAAGLMCAIEAGKRGRRVVVIERNQQVGSKILISGGGRCNFTNLHTTPENFLSTNPHFCKSALARYGPWDFIDLVERHGIAYHEKALGQLFCDGSARLIVQMLLDECREADVRVEAGCAVEAVERREDGFALATSAGPVRAEALVTATGGLSIPKMGATGFGYDLARQFGHSIVPTRAGLAPFTLHEGDLAQYRDLSGVGLQVEAGCGSQRFAAGMLFTHRGLSGPAMLQLSSYWSFGDEVWVNFLPNFALTGWLAERRSEHPASVLSTVLAGLLPRRVAQRLCELQFDGRPLRQYTDADLQDVTTRLQRWVFRPSGNEGYRVAEVTLGGVSCDELSSTTMESKRTSGLYFIGEVVDVTGHLGGFNFQWAWSSGFAAGQAV